ncbi:uncharacterized protein LOC112596883 [Melanaphis sacchari]|uniref:uncharacterized protein LOC112596883 n=1 Tax=Melanaphis sacchari TaxID=742174 RepID=UPI000DC12DCA|nr:uncharacterized protein LOC112596883 [Melanaphis sacchari]
MMFQQIAALLIVGTSASTAFVHSSNQQSSHKSESSYSRSSSHHGGNSYSYVSQSAHGPGYSYSYSHSSGGSPLFLPEYAAGYHVYTPIFIPSIDFDLDFDLDDDLDTNLDFYIDTDLDLDIDLDFPGIEYGLGYVGKYGHLYRIPKYGISRLYSSINDGFFNYGGNYGYLGPSSYGSFDIFK